LRDRKALQDIRSKDGRPDDRDPIGIANDVGCRSGFVVAKTEDENVVCTRYKKRGMKFVSKLYL
jgi:hypothetical protein